MAIGKISKIIDDKSAKKLGKTVHKLHFSLTLYIRIFC